MLGKLGDQKRKENNRSVGGGGDDGIGEGRRFAIAKKGGACQGIGIPRRFWFEMQSRTEMVQPYLGSWGSSGYLRSVTMGAPSRNRGIEYIYVGALVQVPASRYTEALADKPRSRYCWLSQQKRTRVPSSQSQILIRSSPICTPVGMCPVMEV